MGGYHGLSCGRKSSLPPKEGKREPGMNVGIGDKEQAGRGPENRRRVAEHVN
jgi:hypothetical protein